MKFLILICILLLSFMPCVISQNYFPSPNENVNWNVYWLSGCDDEAWGQLVAK
jgi:hypothetical protein